MNPTRREALAAIAALPFVQPQATSAATVSLPWSNCTARWRFVPVHEEMIWLLQKERAANMQRVVDTLEVQLWVS